MSQEEEKNLIEVTKGKVAKFAAFFENEIKARAEKQERWNVRIKAIPKTGRFKGKTPTKVSGKLAALIKLAENQDTQFSAIFKKGAVAGNRSDLHLSPNRAELGSAPQFANGEVVQKAALSSAGIQAVPTDGVQGSKVDYGLSPRSLRKGVLTSQKKSNSIFGKDALLQYTSTNSSPKIQRGEKSIKPEVEDEFETVVDINAWNELKAAGPTDFSSGHASYLSKFLQPNMALYSAVMMYDFDSQNDTELEVPCDSIVHVFEVNEEGWALVKFQDKLGWVPLNYLRDIPKFDSSMSMYNEFGETVFFNAINPNMEIRQLIARFVCESELFSEARIMNDIEIFIDDIDLLLKSGRTISGTLACLLWLDDNRRKYESFEDLSEDLKKLRLDWDVVVDEILQTLEEKRSVIFVEEASFRINRLTADKLMTESAAGDRTMIYINQFLKENYCYDSVEGLSDDLSEFHSKYRAERDSNFQEIKQLILQEMQNPAICIFSSGFIDLDMMSLEQLLVRGLTANEIISFMKIFSDEKLRFESFGLLMGEVFRRKFSTQPPSFVTREYILLSRKVQGLISIEESDALIPQQKVDLMMKLLAKPDCLLFVENKGNLRITVEDLQDLLSANEHFVTVLSDILLMNSLGMRFSNFKQIQETQSNLELQNFKSKILSFLNDWEKIEVRNLSITQLEFVIARSSFFEHPLRLFNHSRFLLKAPFRDYNDLADKLAYFAAEFIESGRNGRQKLIEFLSKNAIFSTPVSLSYSYLDALLESAADNVDSAITIMQELRTAKKRFTAFPALVAAVKEKLSEQQAASPATVS